VRPREPIDRNYRINAVQQALDVLDAFAPDDRELTLAEIARRIGAPMPTAQKLVANLRSAGLIEQNDWSGHFRLGMRLWELGAHALAQFSVWDELRRPTQDLTDEIQGPGVIAVLQGGRAVYVENVRGHTAASGRAWPAHASACGKVLLASLSAEQLEATLSELVLEPWTANTITGPDELRAELVRIRERGYAVDDRELADNVRSVGAPILDHTGTVVAAVGVQLPSERLSGPRIQRAADAVLHAARECSRRLGAAGAAVAAAARAMEPLRLHVDVLGVAEPPLNAPAKAAEEAEGPKQTPNPAPPERPGARRRR
jgi:IclR family KDG regulon transcriptional repressor